MSCCPKINLIDMQESSLKIFEETYHLELDEIQRSLGTTIFQAADPNNYFDTDIPLAVFILDGVVTTSDGKIVEIEKSYYRGDKYKFSVAAKPQLNSKG
jgi:GntR family transcriptional regulator